MAVIVVGATKWWLDVQPLRKLRLEIMKIREELETKRSSIPTATLDEIIEFSKQNPSSHRLKRFLSLKLRHRLPEDAKVDVPHERAAHYSAKLTAVLHDTSSLRDMLEALSLAAVAVNLTVVSAYVLPEVIKVAVEHPFFVTSMVLLGINGLVLDYLDRHAGRDYPKD